MNAQLHNDLTPQGYIRHMFAETKDGKCKVGYENPENGFVEEERTFYVNWIAEDAEKTVQHYNLLTSALARIGQLHNQLKDEENRKNIFLNLILKYITFTFNPLNLLKSIGMSCILFLLANLTNLCRLLKTPLSVAN